MLYPLSYEGPSVQHSGVPHPRLPACHHGPVIPDPLSADCRPGAFPAGLVTAGRHGPLPSALLPETAEVDGRGRFRIGGLDVLDLVEEVGTPVFIYDEEHLRRRCREARQAFGPRVAYASKAFLCRAMAALAHEEGCCVDVSTGGELAVALAGGVPAERLVLHGNNKSMAELQAALEVGVGRIVVDSFDEIDRLSVISGRSNGAGPDRGCSCVSPRASKLTPTST